MYPRMIEFTGFYMQWAFKSVNHVYWDITEIKFHMTTIQVYLSLVFSPISFFLSFFHFLSPLYTHLYLLLCFYYILSSPFLSASISLSVSALYHCLSRYLSLCITPLPSPLVHLASRCIFLYPSLVPFLFPLSPLSLLNSLPRSLSALPLSPRSLSPLSPSLSLSLPSPSPLSHLFPISLPVSPILSEPDYSSPASTVWFGSSHDDRLQRRLIR